MPARERLRAAGLIQATELSRRLGTEARRLRHTAGLTQGELALAVGVSRRWILRFELGALESVDLRRAAVLFAHLGHKLTAKAYPTGEPLRDAGQFRLLDRFNQRLSPVWRRRFESVMPLAGDLRAWDELLVGPCSIGVEAETKPNDLQATDRAIAGKMRDSGVDRAILLIAATARNRDLVRRHVVELRQSFPLNTRETLGALGAGRDPGANGLVIL